MKSLKLIFIFVILIGGIFVALYWNNIFSDSQSEEFAKEDKVNVKDECDDIRNAWAKVAYWSDSLYESQKVHVVQLKSMQMVTMDSYFTIANTMKENATNKAHDAYLDIIGTAEKYDEQLLLEQYNGIQILKSKEELTNDERIQEIENVHSLYKKAMAFIKSSHKFSPKFKKETWTSFDNLRKKLVFDEASNIKNSPLFGKIENIPGLLEQLDEDYLYNLTESNRRSFYHSLSNQIYNYFNKITFSQSKYEKFKNIIYRFESESNGLNNSDADRLAQLYYQKGGTL